MSEPVRLTIDGVTVEAEPTATILEAAARAGIEIPTLCFLKDRPPTESCGVCAVEIEGRAGFFPACASRVAGGMVVRTDSERIAEVRRGAVELLLSDHAGDCVAPCEPACPAGIDVPRLARFVARGDFAGAARALEEATPFGAVLGRVCKARCERACRRGRVDDQVAIQMIERFAGDFALRDAALGSPGKPTASLSPNTKRVAVAGAGVAGLTAAWHLARRGHAVTVFESQQTAGGGLRRVPTSELPADVLDSAIGRVVHLGVELCLGRAVDEDLSLDELRSGFDATILATGARSASAAAVPTDAFAAIRRAPEQHEGQDECRPERATPSRESKGEAELPGACSWQAGAILRSSADAAWASGSGKRAAEMVLRFLEGGPAEIPNPVNVRLGRLSEEELALFAAGASASARHEPESAAGGFDEGQAELAGARCMSCDCARKSDCELREMASRLGADPRAYGGERPRFRREVTHADVVYEPGKCIKCGRCIAIAEDAKEELGLSYIGRGFRVEVGVPFGRGMSDGLRRTAEAVVRACPTAALARRRAGK